MHSTSNLEDAYLGSGKRLRYSINKYGEENHTKTILEFLPCRESLAKREQEIVNQEMLNEFLCMNLALGGKGGFTSDQQKLNSIKSRDKQNWLRENDPVWKEKERKRKSDNLKKLRLEGKVPYDNFAGKFHTEETKQKMRESQKDKQSGDKNSQYGTCWITNGSENKKIKKTENLPDGWFFGRKIK
jgi:hypothetical protein